MLDFLPSARATHAREKRLIVLKVTTGSTMVLKRQQSNVWRHCRKRGYKHRYTSHQLR